MDDHIDQSGNRSPISSTKIPTHVGNFKRSASVRVRGEKANCMTSIPCTPFPSIAEREEIGDEKKYWNRNRMCLSLNRSRSQASGLNRNHQDEDLESLDSFVSNCSGMTTNSLCEHPHFAKNGTTYSGRTHKYIVHCTSHYPTPEEYLTPTQRANKSIKRLKTLLQLAKEKLREKEEEIFKLTKEVVELKVFKASLNHGDYSENGSPSDEKDISPVADEKSVISRDASIQAFNSTQHDGKLNPTKDFVCDTYNDLSPIKASMYYEDKEDDVAAMSPNRCFVSATPDYLLSSLADSGNFDDLASSISLHSKDSFGFAITPDLRPLAEEKQTDEHDREEERSRIVNMYENKLREKKLEYETEIKKIMEEQEEKNFKLVADFDDKLKEEESKFEERWNNLLKSSEEEKMAIVERFESKLEEEKQKYFETLSSIKSDGGKVTDMIFGESYVKKVEEEKEIYETSLEDIKCKFESEKLLIEKNFDDAMKVERAKFEETADEIKRASNLKISELLAQIGDLEIRYNELLAKFNEVSLRNLELEKENEELKKSLDEQEERHKNIYLKMYMKGQEAAKLQHADQVAQFAQQAPTRVSVPELLVQMKITETELENLKAMYRRLAETQAKVQPTPERVENDAETTLQFLKSAVYYFLTDRDNHVDHLKAIESILSFTPDEKNNIEKCYVNRL